MEQVNVYEAKSSFSRLIAAAEAGETVVIARNGKPVAQLGPIAPRRTPRILGDLADTDLVIADDFDDFSDDDARDWYGA